MPTVITCYEIANDAEPPLASPEPIKRQLFRATDPVSRFGYLEVAEFVDSAAADDTVRGIADGAVAALSGSYEAFHENGPSSTLFSAGGAAPSITFINCLQCQPEREDAAFEVWQQVNAYMVAKPGYRWHRLHRRTHDDAPFAFVNVVEWESAAAWQAAHDDGFRALAVRPDLPFVAYPTLCTPVDTPG